MSNKDNIYCIILAAGESARMGFPKALLKIENISFLEHIINTSRSADIENIIVILGGDADIIIKNLNFEKLKNKLNVKFLVNKHYKQGQLSSIHTAINALPEDAEAIILFPVDRPLASEEVLEKLIQQFYYSGKKIIIPTFEGKRGHPVLFSREIFNQLLSAPMDVGARYVVWQNSDELLEVSTQDSGILKNIDTPEDYENYIVKGL